MNEELDVIAEENETEEMIPEEQRAEDALWEDSAEQACRRAEEERDELQARLDELEREKVRGMRLGECRRMLAQDGITAADELLSVLISEDEEQTKQAAQSFAELFRRAVDRAVKEKLRGRAPRTGNRMSGAMTKKQIAEIKDPVQRQQAILDNRDLFGI